MFSVFLKLDSLKRVTSSGEYVSEIDGFRFIAILFVIICHTSVHFFEFAELRNSFTSWQVILERGANGVRIFFAISGFILAHNFFSRESLNIKQYYWRRITRLEPPYIISLLIYFFCIYHKQLASLLPNLIYSIFYLHSWVYDMPSVINGVTWSLEVEIAFYIIFPIIFYLLKKKVFKDSKWQVFFCITMILSSVFLNKYYHPASYNLLNFLHFFLLGFWQPFRQG